MINTKNPLISVITVVFNGEAEIERTILSVIEQNYNNFEFIIIDGSSSDQTINIIQKYKEHVHVLISEKDQGIYDAMNKGLDSSRGEWGIFMNAGDTFANNNVLSEVFSSTSIPNDINFIVGDTIRKYQKDTFHSKPDFYCDPRRGMGFSHQSVFFNVKYHQKNKFDLNFKLMADFEFFCRGNGYFYVPIPISIFETGGASRINWKTNILERWRIFKNYVPSPSFKDYLLFYTTVSKFLMVTLFLGEQKLKRVKRAIQK